MRKFDPASQRSSNPVDEALLLPLTETPVTEELLGSINARLSGKRITGSAEVVEQAVRDSGAGVFPGWEFYAPVAGADRSIFGLLPEARVILDEPEALALELDKVWARIEEAHERSGVGNLVRPADLYLTPESWREKTAALPGADFEYLAMAREAQEGRTEAAFLSQPATRFHGAVPAMIEQVQKMVGSGTQVILAVPNTGEVERLADMFTEYNASYRLGSRTRSGESYADETSYFAGDVLTTTLLKAYLARRLRFAGSASRDFWGARSVRRIGPGGGAAAAAEIESLGVSFRFPRFAGWRLRCPRGARHRAVSGTERNQPGRRRRGIHAAGVCRSGAALCSADPPRSGAEISFVGRREARPESPGQRRHGARPRRACARR